MATIALTLTARFGRILARSALVVAALVLSVLAAEAAARWFYRDVTTTGDFRGYFTTRWLRAEVRQHNHSDFRGPEFHDIKPAGVYRIAVLGDSIAYGNGVSEERRFSNLLHAELQRYEAEVLNFGVPGTNWPDHVATLERRVLRLQPDFVLLQWSVNDIELDGDVQQRPRLPSLISRPDVHEAFYTHSALYTLLNAKWTELLLVRRMGDTYPRYMQRLYRDSNSEGAKLAATLMSRFIEDCRERGVGVGIVLFPDFSVSLGADYPYVFLHERTLALCAERKVPCLDLRPVFSTVADVRTLWASILDAHPGARANEIAAAEILETFAGSWPPGHKWARGRNRD